MSHTCPTPSHSVIEPTGLWPFDPNGTRVPALFASHGIVDRLLPCNRDDSLRLRLRLLRHAKLGNYPERTDGVTKALMRALTCPHTRETFLWSEEFGNGLQGLAQWLFNIAHRGNPLFTGRRYVRPVDYRQSQCQNWEERLARIRECGSQIHGTLVLRECLRLLAWSIGDRGNSRVLQVATEHAPHWLPFFMDGSGTHPIALSAYLELADQYEAKIRQLNAVNFALRHPDPPLKLSDRRCQCGQDHPCEFPPSCK